MKNRKKLSIFLSCKFSTESELTRIFHVPHHTIQQVTIEEVVPHASVIVHELKPSTVRKAQLHQAWEVAPPVFQSAV